MGVHRLKGASWVGKFVCNFSIIYDVIKFYNYFNGVKEVSEVRTSSSSLKWISTCRVFTGLQSPSVINYSCFSFFLYLFS